MFTGIVTAIGSIVDLNRSGAQCRLVIDTGGLDLGDVGIGDSIAVSGCCLTVVELGADQFAADVSNETLECTILGDFERGTRVNLEKAMQASDRFGGHIVSGHVDGVGELIDQRPDGDSQRLSFRVPPTIARYIAAKGSICIDGTSLTVNEVTDDTFAINVIPHTQQETIIGGYRVGQRVNLEVDLIARYLERLMQRGESPDASGAVSNEFLQQHGYK